MGHVNDQKKDMSLCMKQPNPNLRLQGPDITYVDLNQYLFGLTIVKFCFDYHIINYVFRQTFCMETSLRIDLPQSVIHFLMMFKQKSHANDSKKRFFEKCEKMNQNMQQRRGISSKAQQIPLTREGRFKLADVVYYIAACQIMQLEISALRN